MTSKKEDISKAWAALKQINGDNSHIFYMPNNEVVFGRSKDCTIVIADTAVSRTHCIITRTNKKFSICDLSNHGTSLNGVRLMKDQSVKLENADVISICKYKYKFCINKKRLNDAETESLRNTQAKELTNFIHSRQEQLEKITDEINKMGMMKTGLMQEVVKQMEIEIKTKLELEMMEKVQSQIDDLTKKEQELLKVKEEMEKKHGKERAEMEERWRADIEELKRKLEESEKSKTSLEGKNLEIEQILAATRQNLLDSEVEQSRLFEQKTEVESKLEATAQHVVDLTKHTENYQKEIQEAVEEKEKERKKSEEESKKLQSLLEGFEDSLLCSICMEIFIDPYMLGCCHAFCKVCINGWQQKKKTCPMCRVKITSCKDAFFYEKIISSTEMLMPEDARKRREEIIRQRKSQESKIERAKKRKHPQAEEHIVELDGPSTSSAHYSIQPMPYIAIEPMHNPMRTMEIVAPSIQDLQDPFEWGARTRRRRREAPSRRLEDWLQAARPYVGPVAVAAIDLTNVTPPAPAASTSTNITGAIDLTSP